MKTTTVAIYEPGRRWDEWQAKGYEAHLRRVRLQIAALKLVLSLLAGWSIGWTGSYAWAQAGMETPFARVRETGPRSRGREPANQYATFEAFPSSGAGTTGACSTSAPTGVRGEPLTFTRASNGTCTKTATGGLATTGIADGDLVVLSSNVARVEYDSAGTLGLLVEAARTNSTLRSQELDAAAWNVNATVTNPIVTANYATAPDGTLTADRVQYPAVTNAQFSQMYQLTACPGGTQAVAMYVKNNAVGSATLDIYASAGCSQCTVTDSSWTRCVNTGSAGTTLSFGNVPSGIVASCAGGTRAASDLLIWGVQCEAGAYATSYIPTAGVAVARAADSPASVTLAAGVGPSGCIAASATWPSSSVGAVNIAALGSAGAGNNWTLYRNSNTAAGYQIGVTLSTPAVSAMGTTTHRTVLGENAGARFAWWDGAAVTAPAASLSGAQTAFYMGGGPAVVLDGIISRVQVDPSPTRCTP